MQKFAIALVAVALIVGGVFFSGLLDTDRSVVTTQNETGADTAGTERPDLDFGDATSAPESPTVEGASEGTTSAVTTTESSDEPTGTGIVTGTVVDETGAPLTGAVVHLRPLGGGSRWGGGAPPAIDDPTRRLETDGDGQFLYDGLPEDAPHSLFVRGDEWVGQTRRLILPDGKPHTITLAPGDVVSGAVLDPTGRPVSGAEVSSALPMQKVGEGMYFPAMRGHDPNILHPSGVTADNGTFRLSGIPLGEFSLEASHPDWAPSEPMNLMQGQSGVSIELRVGSGVHGIVLDGAGTPVAGATVSANPLFFIGNPEEVIAEGATDRHGRFELLGLPPAQLTLRVHATGFPETMRQVAVTEELGDEIEIVLARGASVAGRVIDGEGVPIAGASVTLRDRHRFGVEHEAPVRTDAQGSFRLEDLRTNARQERRLRIDHPNFVVHVGEPLALVEGEEVVLGDLILTAALTVSGRITDEEGAPIRGARVELVSDSGQGQRERALFVAGSSMGDMIVLDDGMTQRATADEAGHYTLRVEEPGSYVVRAKSKGYRTTSSASITIADESLSAIDIALPTALSISGRVVDELGEPCPQIRVSTGGQWSGGEGARTDESGAFTIDGLDDAAYDISILDDGWQLVEGSGAGIQAGSEGIALVARRPGQIVGRLTDASTGLPITAFTITSQPVSDTNDGHRFSFSGLGFGAVEYRDPEGRFILDRAPGRHRVRFRAEDFVDEEREIEVFSSRESVVSVELAPAGIITGRVVDSDGAPIAGARVSHARLREDGTVDESPPSHEFGGAVSVAFAGGDGGQSMIYTTSGGIGGPGGATTDEDGRFELRGLSEGEYQLRVRSKKFRSNEVSPFTASSGERTDAGSITLERGAQVRGVARVPVGKSLMWCTVRFQPEEGERKSATASQDGSYEIGGLDAGTYTVTAEYFYEPEGSGEGGFVSGGPLELVLGTIELAVDQQKAFDFDLPAE